MDAGSLALPTPTRQRFFVLGLLAFFVALSVQYSFKVLGKEGGSAIVRWKNQIHEIVESGNPYEGSPYPNPPIMIILLTPFALVQPLAGALAWYYLKVTLTLAAVFWVFRLVE